MLMAGAVGLTCVALAFEAIAIGGAGAGIAYPLFLFAAVALLASAGDLRMLRAGGIHGASRLRRHLWRMCFALFIAALAFFSSERRVPAPAPLRVLPVLAVLVTMLYWFWRVRIRPTVRGIAEVSAFQPTTVPASL
jgi:amino acid permease